MKKIFKKFLRDIKGAATIFVTLLLVPAILVSGTAVDISSVYAAKAYVKDAEQLAANALLANYDDLIRDMYALYAVTADSAEMTAIVNAYLSETLFGDLAKTGGSDGEGRILFNNISAKGNVETVPKANLRNTDVLRKQIEEYVKFRAPEFFIENILDTIEKFTKFVPDFTAIILKMMLDQSVAVLYELYEQMYYKLLLNDVYIHDLAAEQDGALVVNPNPNNMEKPAGLEVELAKEINTQIGNLAVLAKKMDHEKENYINKKEEYEIKKEEYDNMTQGAENDYDFNRRKQEVKDKMDKAKTDMENAENDFNDAKNDAANKVGRAKLSALGQGLQVLAEVQRRGISLKNITDALINVRNEINMIVGWIPGGPAIRVTLDLLFPALLVNDIQWGYLDATRKEMTSGENIFYGKGKDHWVDVNGNLYVGGYLNNLSNLEDLLELIELQGCGIQSTIDKIRKILPFCSSALRGSENFPAIEKEIEKYENMLKPDNLSDQLRIIKEKVANPIDENSYFNRLGKYLQNPETVLPDGNKYKLSDLASAIENMALDNENPNVFNNIKNIPDGELLEVEPFFKTLAEPERFIRFGDDDTVLTLFVKLFDVYGMDSYYDYFKGQLEKFLTLLGSNLIDGLKELEKGIKYETEGEGMPGEVCNTLVSQSDGNRTDVKTSVDVLASCGAAGLDLAVSPIKLIGNFIRIFKGALEAITTFIPSLLDQNSDSLVSPGAMFGIAANPAAGYATAAFSLFSTAAVSVYNTHMFSCYTTEAGKDKSYTGYPFSPDANYMFGSEQEYVLFGYSDKSFFNDDTISWMNDITNMLGLTGKGNELNLQAAAGLLFIVRFVFNFTNSLIPWLSINEYLPAIEESTMGIGVVARIAIVYAESLLDVYKLRIGDKVPVVKLVDDHWTVGNLNKMGKELGEAATKLTFTIFKAFYKSYAQVKNPQDLNNQLRGWDTEKIYGSAQTLIVAAIAAKRNGFLISGNEKKAALETILNGIMATPAELVKKATFNDIDLSDGFKDEFFATETADYINKILNGEESEVLKDMTKDMAKDLIKQLVGKTYSDYLTAFMFFQSFMSMETVLNRTGDVIALNVGYMKSKQKPMTSAALEDLRKATTAFRFKTEAKMKLAFMSMPLSQKGVGGVIPVTELDISAQDDRGY